VTGVQTCALPIWGIPKLLDKCFSEIKDDDRIAINLISGDIDKIRDFKKELNNYILKLEDRLRSSDLDPITPIFGAAGGFLVGMLASIWKVVNLSADDSGLFVYAAAGIGGVIAYVAGRYVRYRKEKKLEMINNLYYAPCQKGIEEFFDVKGE
jgi:hypothetical protein